MLPTERTGAASPSLLGTMGSFYNEVQPFLNVQTAPSRPPLHPTSNLLCLKIKCQHVVHEHQHHVSILWLQGAVVTLKDLGATTCSQIYVGYSIYNISQK